MKCMLFVICTSAQLLLGSAVSPRAALEKLLDENASIPTIAQEINKTDLSGYFTQCISKLLTRVQLSCLSKTADTPCAQWIYHKIHRRYSNSAAFKDILAWYDGILTYSEKFGEYTLPPLPQERPSQPVQLPKNPQKSPPANFPSDTPGRALRAISSSVCN